MDTRGKVYMKVPCIHAGLYIHVFRVRMLIKSKYIHLSHKVKHT